MVIKLFLKRKFGFVQNRRSNARQSTLSHDEKGELRLAVMLMTVVVVFQICNILPLIVNILEVSGMKPIHELTQTSNLLVTINSSVNIFIYITMGEKFKRQFLQCLKENMSCCYGGETNSTCCPLLTCRKKFEISDSERGAVSGRYTTDLCMTDALISHSPGVNNSTANHHTFDNQGHSQ